jgi:hypothetical protein
MTNAQRASVQGRLAGTVALTDEERVILNRMDSYLAAGLELKQWWDQARVPNSFAERFELGLTFNQPDRSYGFFDEISVAGRIMPIMGNMQNMCFDQMKGPNGQTAETAQWMRDQLREYVLRYFMRVSDFRQPQGTMDHGHPELPLYLRPFSLCPPEDPRRVGFGFSQVFYKRSDTGQIGRFPEEERFAIVDLRDIGQKYDWIVANVRIFDFSFTYMPFGPGAPHIVLPLSESSYIVLTRDFITHTDNPTPGVLGRYGLGYAFIKDPTPSLTAHGPGQFDAAIELIDFQMLDDGRVSVEMVFVVNRPEKLINLSLNPINWGITLADLMSFGLTSRLFASTQGGLDPLRSSGSDVDPVYAFIWLANVLTGGQAAQQLCLSRDELDKQLLVKHFMQHYQTIAGALHTWRQIPDWLAGEDKLPQWIVKGISS